MYTHQNIALLVLRLLALLLERVHLVLEARVACARLIDAHLEGAQNFILLRLTSLYQKLSAEALVHQQTESAPLTLQACPLAS